MMDATSCSCEYNNKDGILVSPAITTIINHDEDSRKINNNTFNFYTYQAKLLLLTLLNEKKKERDEKHKDKKQLVKGLV